MQNFARERFLLQAQDILISSVAKPRLQSSRHSDSKTFTHHHQILRPSDINQNFETFLALQKKNKKTQLWDPWNATEILRDPRFFKDHLLVRRYYLIWLKFSIHSPPKSVTFYNDLHDLLNKIWVKRKNVILLGDFNCNLLANTAETDQDVPFDCNRMKRILRRFGYFNVIESPTRITANSKSSSRFESRKLASAMGRVLSSQEGQFQ